LDNVASKMRLLRRFLSWLYAIASLMCIYGAFQLIPIAIRQQYSAHLFVNLLIVVVLLALPLIYGTAWWTNWKEKRGGKIWGIFVSLIFLLLAAQREVQSFMYPRSPHRHFWAFFIAGVLGLLAFLRRDQNSNASGSELSEPEPDHPNH
jgi:hypothetical protein